MTERAARNARKLFNLPQVQAALIHFQTQAFDFLGIASWRVGFKKLAIARFAAIVLLAASMPIFANLCRSTVGTLHVCRGCSDRTLLAA